MPERTSSRIQHLIPLCFVLLWSTGFIGAKYGLPYAEPMTFLWLRMALVLVLLIALVLMLKAPWPSSRQAMLHLAVSGLLVHGGYLGGVFVAIDRGLPSGLTALVVGLQPIATAFCAALLLQERVGARQWGGLLLGLIGVILVLGGKLGQDALDTSTLWYWLWPALVALASITAGTLYQKRFVPVFDLRTGAILQFLPCLLLFGVLALTTETRQVEWTGDFIFALLWLTLVLSIGAIALLNRLLRQGSAVQVASLFYLTPLATAVIAWLLFNETLAPLAVFGMGVTVAGVWLVRR
jgi:drug/metabolite transporter (DMT)-like permease